MENDVVKLRLRDVELICVGMRVSLESLSCREIEIIKPKETRSELLTHINHNMLCNRPIFSKTQ